MTAAHRPAPAAGPGEARRGAASAALLVLLAVLSILPDPGAALPRQTYFFRDLSVTFFPVRHFAAEELRSGRWPGWNPFLFEGTFALPYFHALDLLHVVAPGPVAFSWLLTLQFPIAAMSAFALLRDLGAGRMGAFAAGALFALGGLARSSANLYVFLQALALAPLVLLALRRAAERGGRSIPGAALVLALGFTTLALEFVGQAVVLGMAWALVEHRELRTLRRLAAAVLLGLGLAGIAVLPLLGLLPETERAAGLDGSVLLGHATPPLALLQILVPNLFGSLADPVQVWWGQRFFPRLPYFLSLYLGPTALALAFSGWPRLSRPLRWLVGSATLLAIWFALGEAGGLAQRLLPLLRVLRYPSKAWLIPYLAATILAGLGLDDLVRGRQWGRFLRASMGLALVAATLLLTLGAAPGPVGDWAGLPGDAAPSVMRALQAGTTVVLLLALLGAGLAFAVRRGVVGAALGATLLTLVLAADLARSHHGMNPQVDPSFFEVLPEIARELDQGRTFSYPLASSPAFARYLATRPPGLRLTSFFVNRQILSPYLNAIDRVRAPDDRDVTSFTPRRGELRPEDYRPEAVSALLPWMRQAMVTRVLSLDPLAHEELVLRAAVPMGPPGLTVHVYALSRPAPAFYVACRVLGAPTREEAAALTQAPGFDLGRDASLEQESAVSCAGGDARLEGWRPAHRRYSVTADAAGLLVERENFARGWRAEVDGRSVRVLRANGKNRAVPFPAGRHTIVLRYETPLLKWGAALTGASLLLAAALCTRRGRRAGGRVEPPLRLLCPACGAGTLGEPAAPGAPRACPACGAAYGSAEGIVDLTRGKGGSPGYDPHYFTTLPAVEDTHFWFVARREWILAGLRRHVPDLDARGLFDVGCGTGGLVSWLQRSGVPVAGAGDAYREGLRVARGRLDATLVLFDLAGPPPLGPGQSMLGFFDVLEHLEDDRATLEWARSVLAPGGILVLTVPAHPFLFDEMDRLAHHRRRYRVAELRAKLREAGLEIRHLGHFMALLVPLLVAVRVLGRLLPRSLRDPSKRRDAELRIVPGLNAVLLALLRLEGLLGRLVPWPFGTSLLAVAARPSEPDSREGPAGGGLP